MFPPSELGAPLDGIVVMVTADNQERGVHNQSTLAWFQAEPARSLTSKTCSWSLLRTIDYPPDEQDVQSCALAALELMGPSGFKAAWEVSR